LEKIKGIGAVCFVSALLITCLVLNWLDKKIGLTGQ
jgi:hypothetical protein